MNFLIYAVNVISRTALTLELKPFAEPFLSTDDHLYLWLKYRILKYFEDWLTATEVRPGAFEKSEEKKCLFNHKSIKGIQIIVHTLIELAHKVINDA